MILLVNSEVANIGCWEKLLLEKKKDFILSNNENLEINKISKIIFPGIGNFKKVISNLEKLNIKNKLLYLLKKNIPYLGVCVGMQILFNESEEEENCQGLELLEGKCLEIKSNKIIKPHNGWNNIKFEKENLIFKDFNSQSDLYFNHGYFCCPKDKSLITSCLEDDHNIVCSIQKDNIFGVQFHPEKSQKAGLKIINNFLELI